MQNGATPADVANKAGHDDIAALIASHADARGAPQSQPPVYFSHEQLQVCQMPPIHALGIYSGV
jgi:hypothetical protein